MQATLSMDIQEVFCRNIRRQRKLLDLTQADLAERMRVSRPYVAQVESGRTSPTLATVEQFAKALDCPVSVLLTPVDAAAVA